MNLFEFYQLKEKEAIIKSLNYSSVMLAKDLGCCYAKINDIRNGRKIISVKMAEAFEIRTEGLLTANELIKESIDAHRKHLTRTRDFGELKTIEKRLREEILGDVK